MHLLLPSLSRKKRDSWHVPRSHLLTLTVDRTETARGLYGQLKRCIAIWREKKTTLRNKQDFSFMVSWSRPMLGILSCCCFAESSFVLSHHWNFDMLKGMGRWDRMAGSSFSKAIKSGRSFAPDIRGQWLGFRASLHHLCVASSLNFRTANLRVYLWNSNCRQKLNFNVFLYRVQKWRLCHRGNARKI